MAKLIELYEAAIRKHRDYQGDDRCYEDDYELYKTLPEGFIPPSRAVGIDLNLCAQYQRCRQDPKVEYVSPQIEIKRLKKKLTEKIQEISRLKNWMISLEDTGVVNCVYCSESVGQDDKMLSYREIKDHVQTCREHPLFQLRSSIIEILADLCEFPTDSEEANRLQDEFKTRMSQALSASHGQEKTIEN